ncbi:hypothetical protein GF395_03595 [Candidatus Uhrbacteria bacterium]|nr:hypothetical protein [Candidatus Uhrbacteria bacterium]
MVPKFSRFPYLAVIGIHGYTRGTVLKGDRAACPEHQRWIGGACLSKNGLWRSW